MLEEGLISYEVAQLAKQLGYTNGSSTNYISYGEDYVYDNDPNHPESFRKGEIRFNARTFWRNKSQDDDCTFHLFESPTQSLLYKWLREKYNVDIKIENISVDEKEKIYYGTINIGEFSDYVYKKTTDILITYILDYDEYEFCFERCLFKVLNYLNEKQIK